MILLPFSHDSEICPDGVQNTGLRHKRAEGTLPTSSSRWLNSNPPEHSIDLSRRCLRVEAWIGGWIEVNASRVAPDPRDGEPRIVQVFPSLAHDGSDLFGTAA
jgi:hypothetical protein